MSDWEILKEKGDTINLCITSLFFSNEGGLFKYNGDEYSQLKGFPKIHSYSIHSDYRGMLVVLHHKQGVFLYMEKSGRWLNVKTKPLLQYVSFEGDEGYGVCINRKLHKIHLNQKNLGITKMKTTTKVDIVEVSKPGHVVCLNSPGKLVFQMGKDQNLTEMPGVMDCIDIDDSGFVYGIFSGRIYRKAPHKNKWMEITKEFPKDIVEISVVNRKLIACRDRNRTIYVKGLKGGNYLVRDLELKSAKYVTCGSRDHCYGILGRYHYQRILKYEDNRWIETGIPGRYQIISASRDGHIMGLTSFGQPVLITPSKKIKVLHFRTFIDVCLVNGFKGYGIDSEGNIWVWTRHRSGGGRERKEEKEEEISGHWDRIFGKAKEITADKKDNMYVLSEEGLIYYWDQKRIRWFQVPGVLDTIHAGDDGRLWGVYKRNVFVYDTKWQNYTDFFPWGTIEISLADENFIFAKTDRGELYRKIMHKPEQKQFKVDIPLKIEEFSSMPGVESNAFKKKRMREENNNDRLDDEEEIASPSLLFSSDLEDAISDRGVRLMFESMEGKFIKTQRQILKKNATRYKFKSEQLVKVLNFFKFSADRIFALKMIVPRIADKGEIGLVKETLKHTEEKVALEETLDMF